MHIKQVILFLTICCGVRTYAMHSQMHNDLFKNHIRKKAESRVDQLEKEADVLERQFGLLMLDIHGNRIGIKDVVESITAVRASLTQIKAEIKEARKIATIAEFDLANALPAPQEGLSCV